MRDIENRVPGGFSGCVSVGRGDSILFQRAYGYADEADERPDTVDTRLVEGGKLGLDDADELLTARVEAEGDRDASTRSLGF